MMKPKISNIEDFLSGLIFVVVGLAAFIVATGYPLGTPARMGPGLLPLYLGGLLVLIGLGVCLQSLSLREREAPIKEANGPRPSFGERSRLLRPVICVVAGLMAFALLVKPLGLVIAITLLVLIVTQAESGFPIWKALLLGPLLALMAVLIFVFGLNLPFPVWP
jgi:hypothetical protein